MLFLCAHNAGRSQMAMGWFTRLAGDAAVAYSGGSEPAEAVNPAALSTHRLRPPAELLLAAADRS